MKSIPKDLFNPLPLVELISENPRTVQEVGDLRMTENWDFNESTGILHNETQIDLPERSVQRSYSLRLYKLEEIIKLLAEARFDILSVHGEFDGEAYDPEGSSRIIVATELIN